MKKNSATTKLKSYTIDASNRVVGRLASEVATIIRGKTSAEYSPHVLPQVNVTILNIDKIKISEKKLDSTFYYHYSGYPGGMKSRSVRDFFEKSPKSLFLKVIDNMIPANKLKKSILKRIKFE